MGNLFLLQHTTEQFTYLYRSGTHETGTSCVPQYFDLINDGFIFFPLGFVNKILLIIADHFDIGGDTHHIEFVNAPQLRCFCFSRTGHATEFVVHPEIILQSDGGIGLGGGFNLHIFLGFNGLVQTIGVTTSIQYTTGLLIHDLDRPVVDDIFHIDLEKGIGFQ